MTKNSTTKTKPKSTIISTQRYLQFSEVHDDLLVLKNGGIRSVLEVSSINFNLKSAEEQGAIINGYQRFLNGLNFPTQILVRSRKLDIEQYIERLQEKHKKIKNPLLQKQMSGYIDYISKLVEYSDIMEKRFFIVVPLDPPRAESKGVFSSFIDYISPQDTVLDIFRRKKEFKALKAKIEGRIETVKTGLENCGLNSSQLNTEQIIQLFYQSYNPDLSRSQKVNSADKMASAGNPGDNMIVD